MFCSCELSSCYHKLLYEELVRTLYVEKYFVSQLFNDCFPSVYDIDIGGKNVIYIPNKSCSECFVKNVCFLYQRLQQEGKIVYFFIEDKDVSRLLLVNLGEKVKKNIKVVDYSMLSKMSKPCWIEFDSFFKIKKLEVLNTLYENGQNEVNRILDH